MFLAQVHVTYKPSILDPQAVAIKDAMHRLAFDQVTAVRQGKYFEITFWMFPQRMKPKNKLKQSATNC